MELYEAIRGRRSVRRFRPDPIPEEIVERLLEAAQWAPSWAHTQCCRVLLVSGEGRGRLQESLAPTNPAYRAIVEAPLVVAFCGEAGRAGFYKGQPATPRGDWFMFDVALAMQNFMLAAHAEGLGTVCVGMFDPAVAARAVGAPPGLEVVALTPLGYPEGPVKVPPRRPASEFSRREGWL